MSNGIMNRKKKKETIVVLCMMKNRELACLCVYVYDISVKSSLTIPTPLK